MLHIHSCTYDTTHTHTHTLLLVQNHRTCQQYYIEVSSWMIRMESAFKQDKESTSSVRSRASLFINGLLSAYKIAHHVKTILNYHGHMRLPLTKSGVLHLCKLLELLKVPNTMIHVIIYIYNAFCSLSSSPFTVAHLHSPTTLTTLYRPTRQISLLGWRQE